MLITGHIDSRDPLSLSCTLFNFVFVPSLGMRVDHPITHSWVFVVVLKLMKSSLEKGVIVMEKGQRSCPVLAATPPFPNKEKIEQNKQKICILGNSQSIFCVIFFLYSSIMRFCCFSCSCCFCHFDYSSRFDHEQNLFVVYFFNVQSLFYNFNLTHALSFVLLLLLWCFLIPISLFSFRFWLHFLFLLHFIISTTTTLRFYFVYFRTSSRGVGGGA